jgi:hypothetical protein
MDRTKVSVGPTTVAGSVVTLAGFVGAIVAYQSGDRDTATLGELAGGIALAFTLLGRFAQAVMQAWSYGKGLEHEPDPIVPALPRPPRAKPRGSHGGKA